MAKRCTFALFNEMYFVNYYNYKHFCTVGSHNIEKVYRVIYRVTVMAHATAEYITLVHDTVSFAKYIVTSYK